MAIKEKKEETTSRIWEYIKTEHKWENYFFMFISIAVLILGVFILNGTLTIKSKVPIIGSFPKAFAIIIIVVASLSLVYAVYPFVKVAFPELRKVTWPGKNLFLGNTLKVFIFLIVFTLLYLMYDVLVSELISGILKIKG
ncbi:MAG: preprotein translocase subunit SecE [Acholeplasmatales bacterium]|nr:preprotein translocase subunit SecE [Acholeplasmatales bacterium]